MVFQGLEFLDKPPFHTVYIHGTILDEKGQRMSKSKGNGIDPLEMIAQYGADAVRFSLLTLTTEGQDIRLSPAKFEAGRNFANKLWNAMRFVHPHLSELASQEISLPDPATLPMEDRWILARLNETIRLVTGALETDQLRFSDAANGLYHFAWDDFCSRYLEMRKPVVTGEAGPEKVIALRVFLHVSRTLLHLLNPFMPFLTEELNAHLTSAYLGNDASQKSDSPSSHPTSSNLITTPWPQPLDLVLGNQEAEEMQRAFSLVDEVRQIRGRYSLPPGLALDIVIDMEKVEDQAGMEKATAILKSLEKIGSSSLQSGGAIPPQSAASLIPGGKVFVPLSAHLDLDAEKAKLEKELERAKGFVTAQEKKLANEKFVSGAPVAVVDAEKAKLATQVEKVTKLEEALQGLG
jgi:valyl-tRNA synthetase